MRKIFTTSIFKRRNTINAKSSLKKKLRFRRLKREKNKLLSHKNRRQQFLLKRKHSYFDYVKLVVPSNFTFLKHPEQASKFIAELKNNFNKKKKVFIVMKDVNTIDHSAIVILLSIMVRFKSQKIKFNGDFPQNVEVAKKFRASGFFELLNLEELKNTDRYNLGNQRIYTHAWKNVDSELSMEIMKDISIGIHKEKRVYKGLHRTFVELMQNSFNHADPLYEGEKHWWISINIDTIRKCVSFSFIDYGVGIFESLNGKPKNSKWYDWRPKLSSQFKFETNSDILRLILQGELHKTVTDKYFRGKGLPGIKEAMDRNLINRLHVVTNNVYANVEDNIYNNLSHDFAGTFVYWEINENTENIPWIQSLK